MPETSQNGHNVFGLLAVMRANERKMYDVAKEVFRAMTGSDQRIHAAVNLAEQLPSVMELSECWNMCENSGVSANDPVRRAFAEAFVLRFNQGFQQAFSPDHETVEKLFIGIGDVNFRAAAAEVLAKAYVELGDVPSAMVLAKASGREFTAPEIDTMLAVAQSKEPPSKKRTKRK